MKDHTAKQLSTYKSGDVRRWKVYMSDGTTQTVWASTGDQAAAIAEQKRRSECGKNVKANAREAL